MSQESRNKAGGERDIIRISTENGERKNYEGFEGMNYEQHRQPFDPNYKRRNRANDERNDTIRPEEA